MSFSKTYIIILNWNRWADTLECLESVLRSDYPDYQVIVCDNDSGDDSVTQIKAWAGGLREVTVSDRNPLKHLSSPPVGKPLPYCEYTRSEAEAGGDAQADDARLVLIHTGANLGFAGGCNVGLRFALARDDFGYAWLLNNDTVVESAALSELICRIGQDLHAGMCGSTLLYYNRVGTVQALGGYYYNKWLAMPKPVGSFGAYGARVDEGEIERSLRYIAGASLLVSKEFLQKVGLLAEQYFLFFEEIDWAVRAEGFFRMAYASRSVVYHKEGASTGTDSEPGRNSPLSEYYYNRNRIRFTRQFYPVALPTVVLGIIISIMNRIRRRQPENIRMIVKGMLGCPPQISGKDNSL